MRYRRKGRKEGKGREGKGRERADSGGRSTMVTPNSRSKSLKMREWFGVADESQ